LELEGLNSRPQFIMILSMFDTWMELHGENKNFPQIESYDPCDLYSSFLGFTAANPNWNGV
jgi:hypothetical protein